MTPKRAQQLLAEVLLLEKTGISTKSPYNEITVHPGAFIRADSPTVVRVSAEDGQNWCEYYREVQGDTWNFGIHPTLNEFAWKHDCFWEWENPGSIALYEA